MKYAQIKIEDIIILPERHRKGLGDDDKKAKVAFDDLKRSIKAVGLINPIRVESRENLTLLAGYRRLNAARELGWSKIDATFSDEELSELDRQIIELDENLQRLDLSWHEKEQAIARIDKLRTLQDPSWTQNRTAQELGVSQAKVSDAVMLSKIMEMFPEIKKAETRTQAMSMAKAKAKTTLRKVEIQSNPAVYQKITEKVVCDKAENVIVTLADGSAGRLILTDPPFGINYDKKPAADGVHEAYEDSPENYRKMVSFMAPHLFRVLPSDGFLVWFLAHDHLEFVRNQFLSVGFLVDPVPLVWDRSAGRTYSVRPDRWFGKGYDIALHCIKGNPEMIIRSRDGGNVFRYKPVSVSEKEHIVERPMELYVDLIKHMTLPGEKVTDFFGGSGAVAAAASSIGRDHFTVEQNPNHIPTIVNKIFNNTPSALKLVPNQPEEAAR